jgi:molybdopterin converting factor small subunit
MITNFSNFINEAQGAAKASPIKNITIIVNEPPFIEKVKVKTFVFEGIEYGYDEATKKYYHVRSGFDASGSIKDFTKSKKYEDAFIEYQTIVRKAGNKDHLEYDDTLPNVEDTVARIKQNLSKISEEDLQRLKDDGNIVLAWTDFTKVKRLEIKNAAAYDDMNAIKKAFPNAKIYNK